MKLFSVKNAFCAFGMIASSCPNWATIWLISNVFTKIGIFKPGFRLDGIACRAAPTLMNSKRYQNFCCLLLLN
jgi:hypothetical protein